MIVEKKKIYSKQYYIKNSERLKQYQKEYRNNKKKNLNNSEENLNRKFLNESLILIFD